MTYADRLPLPPHATVTVMVAALHAIALYVLAAGLVVEHPPFERRDNLVSVPVSLDWCEWDCPRTPTPHPTPTPPATPAVTPKLARPVGQVQSWVRFGDYPASALREHQEGTTRFRLDIGIDGRVTGCSITVSSGHRLLDAAACVGVTRRGKFTPATDSTGAAVSGSWSSAVRWTIPED